MLSNTSVHRESLLPKVTCLSTMGTKVGGGNKKMQQGRGRIVSLTGGRGVGKQRRRPAARTGRPCDSGRERKLIAREKKIGRVGALSTLSSFSVLGRVTLYGSAIDTR